MFHINKPSPQDCLLSNLSTAGKHSPYFLSFSAPEIKNIFLAVFSSVFWTRIEPALTISKIPILIT